MSSQKILGKFDGVSASDRVVCVGVFDGVHLGHQRIISEAITEASSIGAIPTVVTFHPHPDEVLRPGTGPALLTLPHRRTELLGSLGIEEVIAVEFDQEFSQLEPEAFCRVVLSSGLGAKAVYVGENFRFGRRGSGTADDLRIFGDTHGFSVHPVGLVVEGDEPVSSTRIRDLLQEGAVASAEALLSRPHRLEGRVVRGVGRGQSLDAPTANLQVADDLMIPAPGVYVTRTTIRGAAEWHRSVTSVGVNPTFEGDGDTRVETLVIGYEGDLYDSSLAVDFLEKLREQRKFTDARALAEQIREDVQNAVDIHDRKGGGLAS